MKWHYDIKGKTVEVRVYSNERHCGDLTFSLEEFTEIRSAVTHLVEWAKHNYVVEATLNSQPFIEFFAHDEPVEISIQPAADAAEAWEPIHDGQGKLPEDK